MMAGRSAVDSHFTASRTSSDARRVVGWLGEGVLHRRDHDGVQQHVLRDLQPDRALRRGNAPRVQASWMAEGMPEACWISRWLLVTFAAEAFWSSSWCSMPLRRAPRPSERDLAGDHQHRHARGVGLLQRAERGQRAGTGGQEQHADLAGGPGVPVGAERGVVLHPGGDEVQVAAADRVEQAQRVLAGDAEDGLGAQRLKGLDDEVAAVAHGRVHAVSLGLPTGAANTGRRGGIPGRAPGRHSRSGAEAVPLDGVVRQQGDQLVGDVAGGDAGDLGVVVGRGDLDDVGADEVQAAEAAQDLQQFAAGDAAGLRGAGAGGVGGVEHVDVDGDVERAVADPVAELGDDSWTPW